MIGDIVSSWQKNGANNKVKKTFKILQNVYEVSYKHLYL